ncbi:MAG TPA: hypothetical protein VGF79_01960 [Bacteroidia bacterium]
MKKLIHHKSLFLIVILFTVAKGYTCPVYYYYNSIGLGIGGSNFNGQYFRNIQVSREGQIFWKGEGKYRNHVNYNLSLSSSDAKQEHLRNIKLGVASNELIGGCSFGIFLSPSIQYSHAKLEAGTNHFIGPGMELNIRPYSMRYTFFKLSLEYTRLFELTQRLEGGNFFSVNLSLCLSTIHYKFGHYKLSKGNRSRGRFNF